MVFHNYDKNQRAAYLSEMKTVLLCVGKTADKNVVLQIESYKKRISRYISFDIIFVPQQKNSKKNKVDFIRMKEEERLVEKLLPNDKIILLDEKGIQFDSKGFAYKLEKSEYEGFKRLVFIIGGPYGFSTVFKNQFPDHFALSKMTFSYQIIRLFFCEQLYRAHTILNNHPYHNT